MFERVPKRFCSRLCFSRMQVGVLQIQWVHCMRYIILYMICDTCWHLIYHIWRQKQEIWTLSTNLLSHHYQENTWYLSGFPFWVHASSLKVHLVRFTSSTLFLDIIPIPDISHKFAEGWIESFWSKGHNTMKQNYFQWPDNLYKQA